DHTYMIELDGATSMRKASVKSGGFVRYPFQLISLGSITLTDNKYLIVRMRPRTYRTILRPSNAELRLMTPGYKKNGTSHPAMVRKVRKVLCERTGDLVSSVFQLELYISDKTASTIVVMFDEPEKELLKCFADFLAAADDESGFGYAHHASLPLALANIIGTTHTLEMKSHTYYKHGTFESFTCWRIAPEEVVDVDSESSNMHTSTEELKDSNDEVTGDMDDGGVDGKKSSLTDKRKKKRYIVDNCDSAKAVEVASDKSCWTDI
nr:hypothetical protein [Tanacetum cinerariifolium]